MNHQDFTAQANKHIESLRTLVNEHMLSKGDKEEDCHRCLITNRLHQLDQAFTGVTEDDLASTNPFTDARHESIRTLAQDQHCSDDIAIDEDAIVSEGSDNGAYVAAWVWTRFEGTPLDKEPEEEEDDNQATWSQPSPEQAIGRTKRQPTGTDDDPIRYESLDPSAPDYRQRFTEQLDQFEKDAKSGKCICLSDLIGNSGM